MYPAGSFSALVLFHFWQAKTKYQRITVSLQNITCLCSRVVRSEQAFGFDLVAQWDDVIDLHRPSILYLAAIRADRNG